MKSFKEHIQDLTPAEIKEKGISFKTGVPVTFPYIRNNEKAEYYGDRFQQNIEPAGMYMNFDSDPTSPPVKDTWEKGTMKFHSPLVIPFNTTPGNGYDQDSWKMNIFYKYNKVGKKLSQALKKAGYDGIVTVDLKHKVTSEIVKL